jgi:hypothetical protein
VEVNQKNNKRERNHNTTLFELRLNDLRKVYEKEYSQLIEHAYFKVHLAKAILDCEDFKGTLKSNNCSYLREIKPAKVSFVQGRIQMFTSTRHCIIREGENITNLKSCIYDRIEKRVLKH